MPDTLPAQATPDEILEYLTGVMRGDITPGTAAMKAAELLGKRCGLFEEARGDLPAPVIVDDVPETNTKEGS